jgi:hypothetical protein
MVKVGQNKSRRPRIVTNGREFGEGKIVIWKQTFPCEISTMAFFFGIAV